MITPAQLLDYAKGLQLDITAKLRQLEQQQSETQRDIEFKAQRITLNVVNNLSKAGYARLQEFDREFALQPHIKLVYKNAYFLGLFRTPDYATSLSFVQAQFKARQLQKLSHEAAANLRQILSEKQQLSQSYKQLQEIRQTLLKHSALESQQNQAYLARILAVMLEIAQQLGYPQFNAKRPEQAVNRDEEDEDDSQTSFNDLHRQLMLYASLNQSSITPEDTSMNFAEPQFTPLTEPLSDIDAGNLPLVDQASACRQTQSEAAASSSIKTDDSLGCFS